MNPTAAFFTNLWNSVKAIPTKAFHTLQSRKFWAAVAGTVLVMQEATFPLGETQTLALAGLWIGYIVSVAYEDAHK